MLPHKGSHNDSIKAERVSRVRTKAEKEKERTAIRNKSAFVRLFVSSSIRELSVKPLRKDSNVAGERVEGGEGCAVSYSVFFWSFPEEKNAK